MDRVALKDYMEQEIKRGMGKSRGHGAVGGWY
jgi:hypothetical protein